MKTLRNLFVNFLSIISIISSSSCANMRISDVGPMVQLPYSKECFQVYVLSGRERLYPPEECEKIKARGIIITSETWKLLRGDIQINCQLAKCKQLQGAGDQLFFIINDAANKLL